MAFVEQGARHHREQRTMTGRRAAPVELASARLRIEVTDREPVRLIDVDLNERTTTLTLDAALALAESLAGVLLMAQRYGDQESTQGRIRPG